MAKCWVCGTEDSDTWRFCSARGEFVCMACEQACRDFSRKLLPNGCNCRLTYMQPASKIFKHLSNTSEVVAAKEKYQPLTVEELRQRYKALHSAHTNSNDPETCARLRVELAAICEVAEEKKRSA